MPKQRILQDSEARKGVLLVVALIVGALLLGALMHFLWQRHTAQEQARQHETQYLTLGDQAATVGENTLLLKATVEYEGLETEASLKKALPLLQRRIVKLMSEVQESDLRRLQTPQGKRELAEDIRNLIQETLESKKAARKVKGVLFEKFLIRT